MNIGKPRHFLPRTGKLTSCGIIIQDPEFGAYDGRYVDCLEFTRLTTSSPENYYYETHKDCVKEQERILEHLDSMQSGDVSD